MLARDVCELFTNGFTYECMQCQFELDVPCSLIPEKLTHDGHEHSLILSSTTLDENCSTCEYYCDIYEEERDSKFWFYYCDECSFPTHPKCIFGEFLNSKYRDCRNIKFGSTYTSDIHIHPLTLARKTIDHASCDKCGKLCDEVAYECATCNSIIQVQGLRNCETSLMDFAENQKPGRIEGSVTKLRAERERMLKKEAKSPDSPNGSGPNRPMKPVLGSDSPPPAPIATKRRRYLAMIDEEEEEEEEEEEVVVVKKRRLVKKLGADFDKVAMESERNKKVEPKKDSGPY
ncbi:hypothetical protein SO802_019737 [Lithocarpus litseifolius]|uniref:DC1 domain-containing protein n=1 Tax=Lithocarpus litseifolius TaxID=425828 RepID=A0AAW2CPK6_9ROSI